ncbi:MAG: hypothetical protein KGL39_23260 [Patescibacteria group bacterium]|nr:hypothetical protein [Patescibacteria group bacterium]
MSELETKTNDDQPKRLDIDKLIAMYQAQVFVAQTTIAALLRAKELEEELNIFREREQRRLERLL